MKGYRPAKPRVAVSVGDSVRIVREPQGFSQNELAQRTGIPQATLSAIENDRVRLGTGGWLYSAVRERQTYSRTPCDESRAKTP